MLDLHGANSYLACGLPSPTSKLAPTAAPSSGYVPPHPHMPRALAWATVVRPHHTPSPHLQATPVATLTAQGANTEFVLGDDVLAEVTRRVAHGDGAEGGGSEGDSARGVGKAPRMR